MRGKRVRYVSIGPLERKKYGDGSFLDPSDYDLPTVDHEPNRQFSALDMIVTPPEEEVVGRVQTLEGDRMDLTDDFVHRAILLENARSGRHVFITPKEAKFGWETLPKRPIRRTWNRGEKQPPGSAAEVLEQRGARAPHTNVLEKWRKSGGKPEKKSRFKYPAIGYRRPQR